MAYSLEIDRLGETQAVDGDRPSRWRHGLREPWPLTTHEHAREPIGVEPPEKGMRFRRRSARRPEPRKHLTAKRQPLVDEDLCPGPGADAPLSER